jgi:hypothetical protein
LVGLLGGLATLTVARSRWADQAGQASGAGPGAALTAAGLAGGAACVAVTTYYLAAHPSYQRVHPAATVTSLPPVRSVVLALRPPRWLLPDRHGRRFGIAMAVALVAGFVLLSRLGLRGVGGLDGALMGYLPAGPILVILTGSAAAAAVGRPFRTGLWACAWALAPAGPRAAPGRDRGAGGGR